MAISSLSFTPERVQEGLTLLVDKPKHWTSFDVVNKLRYALRHRTGRSKIKVGHGGTLDPLATGLLLIGVGKHTKKLETFLGLPKTYCGTFSLGYTTASYDLETALEGPFPTAHINDLLLQKVAQQFQGTLEQYPPPYSAVKSQGKRAYNRARSGEQFELSARSIHIERFEIWLDPDEDRLAHFEVTCSKGTYIRSLAHDFGKALDSGAHLSTLQRKAIGTHQLEDAYTLDQLLEMIQSPASRD